MQNIWEILIRENWKKDVKSDIAITTVGLQFNYVCARVASEPYVNKHMCLKTIALAF